MILSPLIPVSSHEVTCYVEITLGTPSRDCRGYGICRLEQFTIGQYENLKQVFPPAPNRAYGTLTRLDNRTLLLRLDRRSMTEKTYRKHFSGSRFRMDEPLQIGRPPNLTKTLLPGFHLFAVTPTEVLITMSFRENKVVTKRKSCRCASGAASESTESSIVLPSFTGI